MVLIALKENVQSYKFAHIKTKETDICLINIDQTKISWITGFWTELVKPIIEYNPLYIAKFFDTPEILTNDIVKMALRKNPKIYKILPNPNPELKLYAAELDISLLEHMKFDRTLIEHIVSKNGLALKYVKKKDLYIIKIAILQNVFSLDYVVNVDRPRQFLIDYAFKHDGAALKYMTSPTYKQCLDAVTRNPLAIQFVPALHNTEEIQLVALHGGKYEVVQYISTPASNVVILAMIECDPSYIFKIPNPTKEIYKLAFKHDGRLMMQFPNWNNKFDPDVISVALSQDGEIFEYVERKTKTYATVAISQYPPAIQWVIFQDLELATLAVNLDPRTIFFVDKSILDKKLFETALTLDPDFFEHTAGEMTWDEWLKIITPIQ
jgi:predicted secreted protein